MLGQCWLCCLSAVLSSVFQQFFTPLFVEKPSNTFQNIEYINILNTSDYIYIVIVILNYFTLSCTPLFVRREVLERITSRARVKKPPFLLDTEPTQVQPGHVVIHDNLTNHVALPCRRCVIQVF